MEINYILLLTLFFALVSFDCAAVTDLEGKVNRNTGLDPKNPPSLNNSSSLNEKTGGLDSVIDSNKAGRVKRGEDQVDGSREGVQNNNLDNNNSSKQLGSKDDNKIPMGKDGSMTKGDQKEKVGEGWESKEVAKEGKSPPMKESSRGEECESSNWCTDKKKALIACLRVPGNESPDLSLLIQNKGKGSLSVTISAPDFVQLEEKNIQLQEKEDKKVKVSIRNGGTDNLIVLTAGNGKCSLDFRDLIAQSSEKETDYISKSTYINLLKRTSFVVFIFLAALVIASAWMCVSFQRRHFASNGSKYQKLDMELPVSGGGKIESNSNDGWDNSWGDSWDDEEAPKTPSMPVTPSLSSKGLASRRFNKDGKISSPEV
ncbi:hypothetical protein F0562_035508 [Nyssa sinensis]|uniref:DUF7356 domain-containing protein n=1 Tax=Nyssa sinensis TaxID=561372 RepID=A0A5J5AGG8_9ASTE|nr:hypothetical protein F0562_035508 [Nyssa sinensis]